ncbi:hypothetical protein GOV11_05170 [Candidatus Woesearchaeota archaeon]|nr:hypothetical protein [Candidatus Woesearchaeota archaeon]
METSEFYHNRNPVLFTSEHFVKNPKHVFIDDSRIETIAKEWQGQNFSIPSWDFPPFTPGNEHIADFLYWGNMINFCFTDIESSKGKDENIKFKAEVDGKEHVGSFAMWACLSRLYNNLGEEMLLPKFWSSLDIDEMEKIFAPISDENRMPLLEKRYEMMNTAGKGWEEHRFLGDREPYLVLDNNIKHYISDGELRLFGDNNMQGFLEDFSKYQAQYDDFRRYPDSNDMNVKISVFNKRTQLLMAMIYGRAVNTEPYIFPAIDTDKLTVFADYKVPQTLRALRIINYSKSLADKVDSRTPILENSREEIEIRSATVHSGHRLTKAVNTDRKEPITAVHMDYKLFSAGKKLPETHPHHFTYTTAY